MKRHVAVASLLAAAGAVFLVPARAFVDDEPFILHSNVRLVLLDVSVHDHAGAFVSGLSQDDFVVYENGHEQQIKVFTSHDLPVTMGVVVDASGSMTPKRYEVINAAELLIRQSNPLDEMFVLSFNDRVRRGLPEQVSFSSDRKMLRDALYRGKPAGKTALYDAVISGLKQLTEGSRDRRTLILISDGRDNASEQTRQELLRQVEESMATIYAIGLYEPGSEDQDPTLLRKLARVSGGEAYFPTSVDQMDDVCGRIAKDIRQRYTVGYRPEDAPEGATDLRQIRLRVKGPDHSKLIARSRASYRYDRQSGTIQETKPAQSKPASEK